MKDSSSCDFSNKCRQAFVDTWHYIYTAENSSISACTVSTCSLTLSTHDAYRPRVPNAFGHFPRFQ